LKLKLTANGRKAPPIWGVNNVITAENGCSADDRFADHCHVSAQPCRRTGPFPEAGRSADFQLQEHARAADSRTGRLACRWN